MWFFVAALILWASTVEMAGWESWQLPPVTQWAWWTCNLYVCGVAATTSQFANLAERVMGLFGYSLIIIYYLTMYDTYIRFLPEDAENPDLWPAIFLAVNLLGPLLVITVGLIAPAVQRRRGW